MESLSRYISKKQIENSLNISINKIINKDMCSKNTNYIVKSNNKSYFIKIIKDYNKKDIKISNYVQNKCHKKDIAPKNLFIKYQDNYIIKCNEYIENYEPTNFIQENKEVQKDICILFGNILSELHNTSIGNIPMESNKINKLRPKSIKNEEHNINKINSLRKDEIIPNKYINEILRKMQDYDTAESDETIHLPDFTTQNVIFNADYSKGYIIDWEWMSVEPKILAFAGVWYRLIRNNYKSEKYDEKIWVQLKKNYQYNISSFKSEIVRWSILKHITDELNRFNAWNRGKSKEQRSEQIKNIINRVQYI